MGGWVARPVRGRGGALAVFVTDVGGAASGDRLGWPGAADWSAVGQLVPSGAGAFLAAGCAVVAVLVAFRAFLPGRAVARLESVLPSRRPAGSRRWSADRLPAPIAAPAAVAVRMAERVRLLRRRRRDAESWRVAIIELCEAFAAELTAGRSAEAALLHAAGLLDERVARGLAPVRTAASFGGDVAAALERVAERPGGAGLRLLAACWRIGVDRGGALAAVVDRLASALREEEECRADVTAQLAGPRASARLLAALPALGLAMAAMVGARPLAFLFGSWPGAACLVVALGLDVVGVWWTTRIASTAELRP